MYICLQELEPLSQQQVRLWQLSFYLLLWEVRGNSKYSQLLFQIFFQFAERWPISVKPTSWFPLFHYDRQPTPFQIQSVKNKIESFSIYPSVESSLLTHFVMWCSNYITKLPHVYSDIFICWISWNLIYCHCGPLPP